MSLIEETFMHRFVRPQVLALALLWMILTPALALAAGEAGFAFLKLGVGARPMGMGSAYVALADDPTAVYWNPAGLASAEGTQLLVMHNEWIQDFRQEFAAVSGSLGPGAFGFGLSGFYTSEFEGRDDVGTLTRHFGFNDLAVTGAKFGYDDEKLSFGVGLIRSRFHFDYALVPLSSDLGTSHFFSVTARL